VGEFEAVTKGSAGGKNRVPQAQRANFYAEVNGASGAHFVEKDSTISWLASSKSSHLELRRFTFGLYVRRASHVCRNDTVVLVVFGQSCRTGDSISARSCR